MNLWDDLRYSARSLRREPGFAATAVLTVALGIGANTAIFSVVDGVLLRPLPYSQPERLVGLREVVPAFAQTYPTLPVSARHFVEWRQRTHSFERFSVIDPASATLTAAGEPVQLDILRVSADLFRTLGVEARFGRTFADGEDQDGHDRVAVISDSLWRERFHSDPAVVGRTIHLNARPFTVIGVLPPQFRCPSLQVLTNGKSNVRQPGLFIPKVFSKDELGELMGNFNYNVVARLKPGVTIAAAGAELNLVAKQLEQLSGEKLDLHATVSPLLDSMVGQSRRGLMVLLGAVAAVLLIVCANLANVMLARAERQSRESAIRTALGAGFGRLIRHSLTEALLIALLGGTLGTLIAAGSLGALVRIAPADIARLDEVRLDARVLGFAIAITTVTGLLFGLAPAWRSARTDPQSALKAGGRSASGTRGGLRLRSALVMAEVSVSTVLIAAAALLISSFFRVIHADKGFRAPTVLAADVQIPSAIYQDDRQHNQFFQRVIERLAAQPGVIAAAVTTALPLQGETWLDNVAVPGDTRSLWQQPTANIRFVSPDYFRAMGIPMRTGRPFRADDRKNAAIVSEGLAGLLWPGQDAVGRQFTDGDQLRQVIGVAGDVRADPDKPPVAMVYRPYWDWSPTKVTLVARAMGEPRSIAGAIRASVHAIDPNVPPSEIRTLEDVLDQSVAQRRFQMRIAGSFAAAALLLAALGIYGVVSYSVARRTQEMGIRMALGARANHVYRMIVRQSMAPVFLGLAVGVAGALAAGRVMASLLYEVSPRDPSLLAAATLFLAVIGIAASVLPARRAVHTDPLQALREQ